MAFDWCQNIRDFSEGMGQISFKGPTLMTDPFYFKESWPEVTGSTCLLCHLLTLIRPDWFLENPFIQIVWVAAQFCKNMGDEPKRFLENSPNRRFWNFRAWHKQISGKLIQATYLIWRPFKFKSVKLMTQNWSFEKISDEFSSVWLITRTLKFRNNFWMGFQGFAHKGFHEMDFWF